MRARFLLISLLTLVSCTPELIPPLVEIGNATNVTETSAMLSGTIISSGNSYITYRTFYWGTDPNLDVYDVLDAGNGPSAFKCMLYGLTPGTTYYFRAVVANSAGTAESRILSFTTIPFPEGVPTVSWIGDPHDIGESSASFSADIISDGNLQVSECGFCWTESETDVPVIGDDATVSMPAEGLGAFEKSVVTLKGGTSYRVRAWASNQAGIGYSQVRTFTTLDPARIRDTDIQGFLDEPVSDVARYRITAHVYWVFDYSNMYVTDDADNLLYVWGMSSSAAEFANLGIRQGDSVTLVGYRQQASNTPILECDSVEGVYKLTIKDFLGKWEAAGVHKSDTDVSVKWTGIEAKENYGSDDIDRHFYFNGLMPSYTSDPDAGKGDTSCNVDAYYDSESGRVALLGGYTPTTHRITWRYLSDPDQYYQSVFYPVKKEGGDWVTYPASQFAGYPVEGTIMLEPFWEGGQLCLVPYTVSTYQVFDFYYDSGAEVRTDRIFRKSKVMSLTYFAKVD